MSPVDYLYFASLLLGLIGKGTFTSMLPGQLIRQHLSSASAQKINGRINSPGFFAAN